MSLKTKVAARWCCAALAGIILGFLLLTMVGRIWSEAGAGAGEAALGGSGSQAEEQLSYSSPAPAPKVAAEKLPTSCQLGVRLDAL